MFDSRRAIAPIFWCIAVLCVTRGLDALPPPIPLKKRVKEAPLVILGVLQKVSDRGHTGLSRIVNLRVKPLEVLKGKLPLKILNLTFLTFPEALENKLTQPPKPGRYIILLRRKIVRDARGKRGVALVLWEPRVFAFEEANPDVVRRVKLYLIK